MLETQDYQGIGYYLLQYKYMNYPLFKDLFVLLTIHSPEFVCFEYNHTPQYEVHNFWVGQMERWVINAANLVISPSKYALIELSKKMDLHNQNCTVLANPFKRENGSSQNGRISQNKTIVFVGKLSRLKGTFALLDNLELLNKVGASYS